MSTARTIAISTLAVFAAVPAAGTLFLLWKRHDLSKRVAVHTKIDTEIPSPDEIRSIPQKLRDAPSEYVLSIERASKVVPRSRIKDVELEDILVKYLRANMITFTYTPQSPILKSMCADEDAKRTFEAEYLDSVDFEVGDLVTGVFRVVVKEKGRIEMALDPHESFSGPKSEGRIVARVEERGRDVVFINDTIMWRERRSKTLELIERKVTSWLHEVMVMWLVDSGTKSTMLDPSVR